MNRIFAIFAVLVVITPASPALAEDVVEFLNGAKVKGTVKEIRKEKREFDFEVVINGQTFARIYQFSKVHAVTMNGKRFTITAKSSRPSTSKGQTMRSKQEVQRLIKEQGSTDPDWLSSTALTHPKSLDLSWPKKAEGKWNNQKNMGQYLWDVIYPNPNRWRGGVKLIYHCADLHKNDSVLLRRDMETIGSIYFRLFQDYPRAAHWLQKSRVQKGTGPGVMLAECYWRMGSKQMALEMLNNNRLPLGAIKLFGDMGQIPQVMKWTNVYVKAGRTMEAYLMAGDAMRKAGKQTQAIQFYQRVISAKNGRNKQYDNRYRSRARESIEAIRVFDQSNVADVKDGSYRGTTTGYNGPLEVEVQVASGKITSVKVLRHKEKQFYSALIDTPRQIIAAQSVKRIDATSRATITSQAIVNATAKALASGAK